MMSDTSDDDSDEEGGEAFQVPAHALQHTPASPAAASGSAAGKTKKQQKKSTAAVSEAALLDTMAASFLDSSVIAAWDRHLGVDPSALQAASEFKALFGASTIAAVEADEGDGPPEFNQAEAAAAGAAGKRAQRRAKAAARAAKRAEAARDGPGKGRRGGLKLTTPGDSWPAPPNKMAGGLFMTQTSSTASNVIAPAHDLGASTVRLAGEGGGRLPVLPLREDVSTTELTRREFKYEHGTLYASAQADYTSRVSTYDPQAVVGLLHSAPWHVDTNLQVAEIQRATRQTDEAAELLKRALYSLESAWHPQFAAWGTARVRLPWRETKNRSLFTALFRHAHSCAKGGAPRTALQLCKLLLQLDSTADPLKALLGVGYYAVKAQAFTWLRAATQPPVALPAAAGVASMQSLPLGAKGHSGQDASVVLLPSIAYQRALAGHGRMATCLADSAAHTTSTAWSSKDGEQPGVSAVPLDALPAFGVLLPEAGDDAAVWVALSRRDKLQDVSFAPQALMSAVNAVLLFPQLAVRFLGAIGVTSSDMGTDKLGGLRAGMAGGGSGPQAGAAGWPCAAVRDWTESSMAVWAGVLDHPLFQVTPEQDAEECGAGDSGAAVYHKLLDIAVARDANTWKDSAAALLLYHAMALAAAASDSAASAPKGEVPGGCLLHPSVFQRVFRGGQPQAAAVYCQAQGMRHACMCAAAGVDVLSPTDEFDLQPGVLMSYSAAGEVWRHYASAVASDFSDDDATMAAEMLAAAGGGGGDGGGFHADDELDMAALHAQAAGLGGPIGPVLGEGMETPLDMRQNPVALFLNSMLPWARVQQGGGGEAPQGGAEPHEGDQGEVYDEEAALAAAMDASIRDAEARGGAE